MSRRPSVGRVAARLAAWLGPWAGARVPAGTTREIHALPGAGGRTVRAYVTRGRSAPRGVYLVAPGLHYAWPDDPRLDRFCRVLAHAGFVVVAPFLSDFCGLRIARSTTDDLAAGLAHAIAIADAEALGGPAVFAISFGSQPAIELCARDAAARVSRLVLFGGFCDFDASVRFAISGRATHGGAPLVLPHDPLNAPVVHLNLLGHHEAPHDREALARALRAMVERTWGQAALKVGDARAPIAQAIAGELDEETRRLFFAACGLASDAEAIFERALARSGDDFSWTDPRPHLGRMRPPVTIVHGRDDDVIPWPEAEKLAAALPPGHPHEVVLTGLYGHTAAAFPPPRALVREAQALSRVVRALATAC